MGSEEKYAIERMTSPEAFARWLAWHIPVLLPRRPAELATEPEALGGTIQPGKPQRLSRSAIARLRCGVSPWWARVGIEPPASAV
jgi:hypothetical protein